MTDFQLSTLEQDAQQLQAYITEVFNRGNRSLAVKLTKKLEYLQSRIADKSVAA